MQVKLTKLEAQDKKHQEKKRRREEDETATLRTRIAELEAKQNARDEIVAESECQEKKKWWEEADDRSLCIGSVSAKVE